MGRNQYWAGRVYDLCVYYMTGTPEGSTESGFMEKPEIEPATPVLQGIALIHYTTGASRFKKKTKKKRFMENSSEQWQLLFSIILCLLISITVVIFIWF